MALIYISILLIAYAIYIHYYPYIYIETLCMILMLSLCGCTNTGSNRNKYMSNWFKSEQKISDNTMKQMINLYSEGNVEEFKKLFSKNSLKIIEDIDKQACSVVN